MTSSRVYCASIQKVPPGPSDSKEPHIGQRLVIRKYDFNENDLSDQESERRHLDKNHESSTKILLFKEISSMDEDELLGRKDTWQGRLRVKKKMKLSEENNDGIAESFENFCEMHKRKRQLSECRPRTTDVSKVSKPHLQPTAERGLRNPYRPLTAGNLADIAVTKYPDSIFKVFIPEGNKTLKKKRVVPILNAKPQTPPRSPKLTACKVITLPDKILPEMTPGDNAQKIEVTLQTKKNSVPRKDSQPEKCSIKAAEVSSDLSTLESPTSLRVPKNITHLTDISLTQEQREKRLKDRAMMRKRKMNVIKKAFPASPAEDSGSLTSESRLLDEIDANQNQFIDSSKENSGDYIKKKPSTSKSSLKSAKSVSSKALSAKRSVTWSEELLDDSFVKERKRSQKKKTSRGHQVQEISRRGKIDSKIQRLTKSVADSRNNKFQRGTAKVVNKTDKFSGQKSVLLDESQRNEITLQNNSEITKYDDDYGSESDNHKYNRPYKRPYLKECLHGRNSVLVKGKKNKLCKCGNSFEKKDVDKRTKMKSTDRVTIRQQRNTALYNPKYKSKKLDRSQKRNHGMGEENFQSRRNAIMEKHYPCEKFDYDSGGDSSDISSSEGDSRSSNVEESDYPKRGRSTPSILRKPPKEDLQCGSSDTELRSSKKGRREMAGRKQECHFKTFYLREANEDKPLSKIFAKRQMTNRPTEELKSMKSSNNVNINHKTLSFESDEKPNEAVAKNQTEMEKDVTHVENTISTKKEEKSTNSKSMGSLERVQTDQNVNQNVKKTTSSCFPLRNQHQLDDSHFLAESYSALTDVEHKESSYSKSLSILEASNTSQLSREPPMLNISLEEKREKSIGVLSNTTENNNLPSEDKLPKKLDSTSLSINTPKTSDSVRDKKEIVNDYKGCPLKLSVSTPGSKRAFSDKSLKPEFVSPKNAHPVGNLKGPNYNTPPSAVKTISKSNINRHHDSKVINKQMETEKKSIFPQISKALEERRIHLKSLLAKQENKSGSKATSQILEIWNSTQKSINERKEKMLASIRESRGDDKTAPLKRKETKKSLPPVNYQTPKITEKPNHTKDLLLVRNETAIANRNESVLIQKNEVNFDSTNGEDDSFEDDYFQDLIVHPGARGPQPYSLTDIVNASATEGIINPEDNHSLFSHTYEPEKPLCESVDFRCEMNHFDNCGVEDAEELGLQPVVPEIEDAIPERDINTTSPSIQKERTECFSDVRNATVKANTVTFSSSSNDKFNHNVSSVLRKSSVEDMHSDGTKVSVAKKPSTATPSTSRNVTVSNNPDPVKATANSPVLSRPLTKSRRYSSRSHVRSTSKRSKASSSGSSRRSVRLLERPPSRKPHMVETSDEDSDQGIILPQSPQMNIFAGQLGFMEPQKKPPPSRMYSTLKETPHSAQEKIKSAIRDFDGLNEECGGSYCSKNERPLSRGFRTEREEISDKERSISSSRPCSEPPRSLAHRPKMSPGSIRILQEKAMNAAAKIKNLKENISDGKGGSLNDWVRSTRRQEFQEQQCCTEDRKTNKLRHSSPDSSTMKAKPPFRNCTSIKKNEDNWLSPVLKRIPAPRNIANYVPPWERVNLSPPERFLQDRAVNEKRPGVISKAAVCNLDSAKRQNAFQQSVWRGRPGSATPKSREFPGSATPKSREFPGSATPKSREFPGSATPKSREFPGTATPKSREFPGSATPKSRELPGTATPRNSEFTGSATPRSRDFPGTATPKSREAHGGFVGSRPVSRTPGMRNQVVNQRDVERLPTPFRR